ncbi:putative ferric-chelate reductase 1 isoform X4 [Argonauta hians]
MVQQARWQRCWFQWCAAVLVLLVGNASMPAVHAFSNGARGCIDMTPVHGVLPQASAVPFSVTFAPQQPRPGEAVTVKIQGNSNSDIVMGFLIVARVNRSDSNHGTFTAIPDTKLVANCQSAALTHSTRLANNVLSFQWTAPATIPSGLLFVATVVKDKSTFWTDIRSAYIKAPDPSQTVSPTTTTTAATTTIETWTCSTRFECSISWQFDNSTQSTEFVFRFDSNQHQYLALGLSTDNKMGTDSVMACMVRGNTFRGRYSYNKGKKNNPLSFFRITNGTFDGGIATCRFNLTNSNTNDKIFDIGANKWYLLAALGSVSPEFDLLRHVYAISTASLVDLRLKNSDQPKSAEEVSGKKSLVLLHGITMIIGWVLFASVGMFVARYSKNINKKLCSLLFWFQIHRLSMVLVLVLTVVGFIAIFVGTEGKYSQFTTTTMKAHPPLGLIVTILVIFNPVLGYFRPGKDSPYRVTFNWVHRITGIVAMVFADTTIFIGIMMYSNFIGDQAMQRSFLIEISLFLVYKFIAICVMEGIQLTKRFSASVYEMNAPGQNKPAAIETQKDETLMKLLLLGHIVICVGFTVALSATFF